MTYGTINLIADKVDIGKKRIDGNRVVSIECGENKDGTQFQEMAKILLIPEGKTIKVRIEVEE